MTNQWSDGPPTRREPGLGLACGGSPNHVFNDGVLRRDFQNRLSILDHTIANSAAPP
jgi:hypothetical protein